MQALRTTLVVAALGLITPGVAEAKDLNSLEQVTSITQFSDVVPTDWAYQALSNLIERYGCVLATPTAPTVATGR